MTLVTPSCRSLPNLTDRTTAVFVGRVQAIYPAESFEEFKQILFGSTHSRTMPGVFEMKSKLISLWKADLTVEEAAHHAGFIDG